jgi:damage-control phosphatase, subfamily I
VLNWKEVKESYKRERFDMKTDVECIPCIIGQCINTLDIIGCSEKLRREAVKRLLNNLSEVDYEFSPAYNTDIAYAVAREVTGVKDPYYDLKKKYNRLALEFYPGLKQMVRLSKDRLYAAAKISVGGNIIDLGINLNKGKTLDFKDILSEIKNIPFAADDYKEFKKSLDESTDILYLSDNAGEIVFDRVFVEELVERKKNVILSVKSAPVSNDVTMEDIKEVGLDNIVKVIETGNDRIGVNFESASDEFLKEFKKADLIISKGQGNFESLDNVEANTFFMLKAKCEKIARALEVNYLDIVLEKRKTKWGSRKIK